jgi:hypothetical protein
MRSLTLVNRIGFVSNSSTTSFIIIGWKFAFNDPIYKKIFKHVMKKPLPKDYDQYGMDLEKEAAKQELGLEICYDHNIIGIGIKDVGEGDFDSIEPSLLFSIIEDFKKFKEDVGITKTTEVFYGSGYEG